MQKKKHLMTALTTVGTLQSPLVYSVGLLEPTSFVRTKPILWVDGNEWHGIEEIKL